MERIWRIAAHDHVKIRELSSALRVSPLVAQVLVARGCDTADAATKFLAKRLGDLHDPERLPGVPEAAERIVAAAKSGRRITIYGDYDVDGVTATSLLWHCLQLIGAKVDYYIPSRLEEGYGLNCDAIRQLHEADPSRLLVTVDCGITSVAEAVLARELGLELIVTDHHQYAEPLPPADVLVHPRLAGDYPFGDLSGVGVAFKLAWAVCARMGDGKKASPRMREFLLSAIGLAAIGTVADVMPLVGENRVLVHFGLASLKERSALGMQALLAESGLADKPALTAEDIGFTLGPRINAAGRLGQARLAVELLTTEDPERAALLARHLTELNKNRQSVERKMLKQARDLVDEHPEWVTAPVLVLGHFEWHPGVIGIVAGRVAEHFGKPTILFALDGRDGIAQGSGRTFGHYNLHAGVHACQAALVKFGGHHAAVGLKIEPARLDEFRELMVQAAGDSGFTHETEQLVEIDAEVRLADVTLRAIQEIDLLGPFGSAHKRPVFAATQVELAGPPKKMGEGERHLSLQVRQHGVQMRGIAFGRAEWADELAACSGPISICFQPSINSFRGVDRVEFRLIDWQPALQTQAAMPAAAVG